MPRMAELPIHHHKRIGTPEGPGDHDGYRWNVGLEEEGHAVTLLVVDIGGSAAIETGLSRTELDDRLPDALQRYAAGRLRNDQPVLEQVAGWNSPIVLMAEHFR
jgi:hypothetical protein